MLAQAHHTAKEDLKISEAWKVISPGRNVRADMSRPTAPTGVPWRERLRTLQSPAFRMNFGRVGKR